MDLQNFSTTSLTLQSAEKQTVNVFLPTINAERVLCRKSSINEEKQVQEQQDHSKLFLPYTSIASTSLSLQEETRSNYSSDILSPVMEKRLPVKKYYQIHKLLSQTKDTIDCCSLSSRKSSITSNESDIASRTLDLTPKTKNRCSIFSNWETKCETEQGSKILDQEEESESNKSRYPMIVNINQKANNNSPNIEIISTNCKMEKVTENQIKQSNDKNAYPTWANEYLNNAGVKNLLGLASEAQEIESEEQTLANLFEIQSSLLPLQKPDFCYPASYLYNQKQTKLRQSFASNNQLKSQSKFINKNKGLINKLINFHSQFNLQIIRMPLKLQKKLIKIANKMKLSGKCTSGGKVQKSDLFNHSHYNLMFLKLNSQTINKLAGNDKDVKLHKLIYNIDLTGKHLDNSEVQKVNFIKECFFQLVSQLIFTTLENIPEIEYENRAHIGITKMSKGIYISRF